MPDILPIRTDGDAASRRGLRAKVDAERAHFLGLMEKEPRGFLDLFAILLDAEPHEAMKSLEPGAAEMIFRLAALQCADIISIAGRASKS